MTVCRRFGIIVLLAFLYVSLAAVQTAVSGSLSEPAELARTYDSYYGLYRLGPDHVVGIDRFINDDGETTTLYSDYQSGVVRRLFPVSDTEFAMGPNFNVQSPTELTVRFLKDGKGAATGIELRPKGAKESTAARVPIKEEEVSFPDGDVKLAGTLIIPASKGPHPAIALLHGSGPLTRYSFGPYPHFFASLGLAVLIYDKRGTGASSGTRFDASTGTLMDPAFYPEDLTMDALAAFRFLQARDDIDHKRIGLWGSSEGGMLVTQVAARSPEVAFIIDSSGFMGPLWETLLYQAGAVAKQTGYSDADVQRVIEFTKLWMRVARTGEGWDDFVRARDELRRKNLDALFQSSGEFTSVTQMQWDWTHVLSFSPLPDLKKVSCPVLALYGEIDSLTPVKSAAETIGRALSDAGNRDVTVKVLPGAGHSLAVASGDRMAPGVFETLRSWVVTRAHMSGSTDIR